MKPQYVVPNNAVSFLPFQVRISGAIPDFTKADVNMITWNWLQIMCLWLEVKGDRVASEAGNMVSLRMCDYVRKVSVWKAHNARRLSLEYSRKLLKHATPLMQFH